MDATVDEVTVKYAVALDRLQYANLGLYAWEYLTHLDHDWRLVRGVWPWRWPLTTWAYLVCRNATLLAVIMSTTTIGNIPCNRFAVRLSYFLPFPLLVSAAYLMAARAVAIWSRAIWVLIATSMGLGAYLAATIYATIVLRVGSVHLPGPIAYACVNLGPNHATGLKVSITTTYSVDFLCLALIFSGLWRRREARFSGLLHVLWTQSLLLLLLCIVFTGVPLLMLVWIEVNGAILAIGLAIGYLLVGLGTTRMTRALYNTPIVQVSSDSRPTSIPVAPELTTISMPESSSAFVSSLEFSHSVDKDDISTLGMSSTCASSSNRRAHLH